MTVRAVEGKLPYTGGKAITVDENKVISLNLRDENNLIIYDQGDDEIYVDLQLPAGIRPNYAFPVGITTGRVLVADDWDVTGTIIVAKTTSGDVIKLLYGDDGTLWMDNGTGLFKQIYFKADVDLIITNLTTYINTELAKKQDKLIAGNNISIASDGKTISAIIPPLARFLSLWDCETGEPTSFPASTPFTYATGDYYLVGTVDTTTNYRPNGSSYTGTASSTVETSTVVVGDVYIYDGNAWLLQKNSGTGGAGDVQVSTDTGNLLSTGVKLWLGDKADFESLGSLDANTIYAPIEGIGGELRYTPTANTIAYWELNGNGDDTKNDYGITTYTATDYDAVGYYGSGLPTYVSGRDGRQCASFVGTNTLRLPVLPVPSNTITISAWVNYTSASSTANGASIFQLKQDLPSGTNAEKNSWSVYFRIKNGGTLDPFFVYGTSGSNATGAYNFTGTALSTGEWHNVVFTFNAGTAKYYIDGVLKETHTVTGPYLRSQGDTPSNIGGTVDVDGSDQRVTGLTGLIQDVIYENTVWSDMDVADYYANH